MNFANKLYLFEFITNYNKTHCLVEEKKDSEFVPFSKNEISETRIETKKST